MNNIKTYSIVLFLLQSLPAKAFCLEKENKHFFSYDDPKSALFEEIKKHSSDSITSQNPLKAEKKAALIKGLQLLTKITDSESIPKTLFSSPALWQDLQLFGNSDTIKSTLNQIDRTNTALGRAFFSAHLCQSDHNLQLTLERQKLIGHLKDNTSLTNALENNLSEIGKAELAFLSFIETVNAPVFNQKIEALKIHPAFNRFKDNEDFVRFIAFFTQKTAPYLWIPIKGFAKKLAIGSLLFPFFIRGFTHTDIKKTIALATIPTFSLFFALSMITMPDAFIPMLQSNKIKQLFKDKKILKDWLETIDNSTRNKTIETKHIIQKTGTRIYFVFLQIILNEVLSSVFNYSNHQRKADIDSLDELMFLSIKKTINVIHNTEQIITTLKKPEHYQALTESLKYKINQLEKESSHAMKSLVAITKKDTFNKETGHRWFQHFGRVRKAFKILETIKTELNGYALFIGELDSYLAVAKLIQEHDTLTTKFCRVSFETTTEKPFIDSKKFWFPLIDTAKAVTNDLTLGKINPGHMILTGLNAGGKSTTLKGYIFMVLFGHAFGYTCAQSCTMSYLKRILSHLSSKDDPANKKSKWIFEAESMSTMMKDVSEDTNKNILIVTDELATGTAHQPAINVLKKFLNHLKNNNNVLSLHSTHHMPLANLEKEFPSFFKNYKMDGELDDRLEEGIRYTFKLIEGTNTLNVAQKMFENALKRVNLSH